jgi:hypothetical protein
MTKSTGELEREAADALRPILERSMKELNFSLAGRELLMRELGHGYMAGRADGIGVFPSPASRALSAEGITIALALECGPGPRPEKRVRSVQVRPLERPAGPALAA